MKIKNTLLILFLFFLLKPDTKAQIGVRVGVNLASMSIIFEDESLDSKFKTGFGAGIFYEHGINENFSVQPELNFIQMGTKYSEDEGEEGSFSFNYFQIPVLAKYAFGNKEALHFYVQGGPYLGYAFGKAKSEYCDSGDCEEEDLEYDSSGEEGPKPLDFGLQVGIGTMINKNFSVDARYIHGFQNLTAEDEEQTIKNYSIFISVGYKF